VIRLASSRRHGFFIPYRHAAEAVPVPYPGAEKVLRAAEEQMKGTLEAADSYWHVLSEMRGPAPAPRFSQDWFPRLDGAVAYALVRAKRPRRILEVGSGHSTRFLARAVKDEGLDTEITCIDPAPRAALEGLAVRHFRCLLQDAPDKAFAGLSAGDVLFVDSSHISMPGTDVDRIFAGILPSLAPGVIVHVHDCFLPDPYPEAWQWRGYNEQTLLAALMGTGVLRPIFASHYVATRMESSLDRTRLGSLEMPEGAFETSFWAEFRPG
jgi:predicted O-methyltransferase YrrM